MLATISVLFLLMSMFTMMVFLEHTVILEMGDQALAINMANPSLAWGLEDPFLVAFLIRSSGERIW